MIRGIGLRGAVAMNVITMIGIGPLVTIPLVLAQLAGPLALAGWIAGAIVALCDGLVWAELGSRYPGSGGTYVYLREVFGRERWGRVLAFLFNWQFLLYAPFLLASGYIGFANYLGYLVPSVSVSPVAHDAAAVGAGVLTIVLLYRRITAVAAIGIGFAVAAVGTLLLVIAAAFTHAGPAAAFAGHPHLALGTGFFAGLGGALYITLYDYVGYGDAALLGDEVRDPRRTIPAAIVLSIVIVAVLYVALQVGVLGAVPWQSLVGNGTPPPQAQFVASTVVANAWGTLAARVVTVLILLTAFASLYGNLVGFSRIPFAAARDGAFLPAFARLHPTQAFPTVSMLAIGIGSLAASFFSLDVVIAILTAGIVLVQSVAQIAALFVARARFGPAPFRMWLFPVPAILALGGWLYAFAYTGPVAIGLSLAWLCAGAAAYLFAARAQRFWPFAAACAAALVLLLPNSARAAQWPGSAVVHQRSYPVFTVSGKPFFVYGASFFYERIPREQWADALQRYRALGINTIDLYVMWNWHEPNDGDFDFTGRTNARRDLAGLFRLIDRDGFKVVLRPGPVIRNEWRNGGYPAWLLERPAYAMPLRDVLEGRYPATATLQNAHSDDAAAQWMRNATHMRYATRWLRRVLQEVAPWRRDVIAIALDDDQGAYIDNQTWPAPHFQRYIRYLASVVRGVTGSRVPLFINTYQMKVTASAPVWAWGNWYQSDAYGIGEHDRSQLEFSTGLLQTQPSLPVMVSEFQAGWLQGADEALPRAADPSNTTLALHTMLQMNARGVVNFPVQDTLDPAGWEAPWANAFYSWDAAFSVQLQAEARWAPTAAFGALIDRYGPQLARTHAAEDAGIIYATSAYDAAGLDNAQIAQIAAATISTQRGCRIVRITCGIVDLRYATQAQLARYRVLILPHGDIRLPYVTSVRRRIHAYLRGGGRVVSSARAVRVPHPAAGGLPNAALLVDDDERYGFLDAVNYGTTPLRLPASYVHFGSFHAQTPALTVRPRSAALVPLGFAPAATSIRREPVNTTPASLRLPLRADSWVRARFRAVPAHGVAAYSDDVYRDGYPALVLENAFVRLVVSPCAGARAFVFEDKTTGSNLFTTVGGLRDAWTQALLASPRDYIARYTHPIATGTFNRCYATHVRSNTTHGFASFAYNAPDAPPHGAIFWRTITMPADSAGFTVRERATFPRGGSQRARQLTSISIDALASVLRVKDGFAFFDERQKRTLLVAWPRGDVIAATIGRHPHDALLTLAFGPGGGNVAFRVVSTPNARTAQAALAGFANRP